MNNSPRLNQQLIDLQIEIDAASLKLKEMRQVLILETRVEEKLRLEHQIELTEKILDQLHQRYDDLEEKLEEIGLKELPDAAKNPYKSLAAFQEEDAEQFFGRETFVKLLIEKYQQVKILPLLGPSGSGKSSVARAGLIPELKQIDIRLKVLILTPTDRPLENLANHLARLMTQDPFPIAKTKEFEDFLLKEKDALRRILSSFISSTQQTIVILIDQFEEIYTLCKDKTQQTAFIENILTLNEEQHLSAKIVLTLRSDFLGETQQHSKLNQLLAKDSVIVPAMNENELRDAIAQPAELAGHSLDEATINLLLEQTEGRASALPLLQFALTQIWDNMSKGISAAQTLSECGGVGGALAKKAEEVFAQLTEEDQKVTRRIFLKLVQLGEGAKDTRRRTPLSEMIAQHDESTEKVKLILENFAHKNVRLVSLSTQDIENNDIFAEITHEALLEHWQTLKEWLKDGREAERFHRRVHEAAQLWQLNQRPIGSLWRSPDLDLLATFYASHSEDMTTLEIDFFNSSREQQQREINEKLKQQRRLKLLTTVALLVAIIAGFFFFQAEKQTKKATEQRNEALKTQSLFLADLSRQELEKGNATVATLLALEGLPTQWDNKLPIDRPFVHQAAYNLCNTLESSFREYFIFQHDGEVNSAVFSPNGQQILTGSDDKTAKLWDSRTGNLLQTFKHDQVINTAFFSPNGQQVLTPSFDNTAKLWDSQTGNLLQTFKHDDRVENAVFSPNGQQILTGSDDKTAKLWDNQTGNLLQTFKHDYRVNNAAFSPNGQQILTASGDNTAKLWDNQTGNLLQTFRHDEEVRNAVFSPNSQQILTSSIDKTAKLWDSQTGNLLKTFKHDREVTNAAFGPNGQQILTIYIDKTAKLWDSQTGYLLQTFKHDYRVNNAAFSPNGQQILTSSMDKTAKLWDSQTGYLLQTFKHDEEVRNAFFSPNGQRILTASVDKTAKLWSIQTGSLLQTFDAIFSPNDQQISWNYNAAKLWDSQTGKLLQTFEHDGVTNAVFNLNAQQVLTASYFSTAKLWDSKTGKLLQTFEHDDGVNNAVFSPNAQQVLTASYFSTAKLWDSKTGKLLQTFKHDDWVSNAVFSPSGQQILTTSFTTSSDNTVKLWDSQTSNLLQTFKHDGWVNNAVFSPNGQKILTTSSDETAKLWDSQTGKLLQTFKHDIEVIDVVFSSNGQQILTISRDNTAKLWDVHAGHLLQTFKHDAWVTNAILSPNSQQVLITSSDKITKLWDSQTGHLLQTFKHDGWVSNAVFSPNGQQILTASDDGVKLWKVFPTTEELINYAKEQLPMIISEDQPPRRRTLTCEERQRFFLSLPKECTAVSQVKKE
jgi:WD40 repeat protein